MIQEELNKILELHRKWLNNELGGRKADLRRANLINVDLRFSNLRYANLSDANLRGTDLSGTDLSFADLSDANLTSVNLSGADLSRADLRRVNLTFADLRGADLYDVDLGAANLRNANLIRAKNIPFIPELEICPSEGSFIGWKRVNNFIIKLQILEDSKRSSATTRKCRCDKALVLEIQELDGTKSELKHLLNKNCKNLDYIVGEVVYPDKFDENRWDECSHGIHFFITRQEAVVY